MWILTDSAQEVKSDPAAKIEVVSLPVSVNGEELEKPLDDDRFLELLESPDAQIRTSQASPARFEEVFKRLTQDGEEVVAIMVSSTLSGTYNSARLAAMDFPGVHLIDSRQACMSQSALVLRAIELRAQGLSASEIVDTLEKEKEQVQLYAMLPTLKYLKKGGRISPAKAAAADLVGIKPIVTIDDSGDVEACAKTRGIKKALRRIAQMAAENQIDLSRPVIVGFSGSDPSNAELLIDYLKEELKEPVDVHFVHLSQLLTVHAGPGGAGMAFFSKEA